MSIFSPVILNGYKFSTTMLQKKYEKKFILRTPGWDFFLTPGQTETIFFPWPKFKTTHLFEVP